MPSYKLIFYVLFCTFVGLSVMVQLMKSNRSVAGISYLILAILIFIFFGLRWFGREGKGVKGQWPPIINACPDYLTRYTRQRGSGPTNAVIPTCIDTVGVSRNAQMKKWPTDGTVPTDNAYYFTLDGTMEEKCRRAKAMGLSWEVCDSFSPSGVAPEPSGSTCVPV
jgi:hypothetical protein